MISVQCRVTTISWIQNSPTFTRCSDQNSKEKNTHIFLTAYHGIRPNLHKVFSNLSNHNLFLIFSVKKLIGFKIFSDFPKKSMTFSGSSEFYDIFFAFPGFQVERDVIIWSKKKEENIFYK